MQQICFYKTSFEIQKLIKIYMRIGKKMRRKKKKETETVAALGGIHFLKKGICSEYIWRQNIASKL